MLAIMDKYKKYTSFEFWPNWLLYLPVVLSLPYWLVRYRSLSVMALANPGFYLGGIKNENKFKILASIPAWFKPKTIAIPANSQIEEVLDLVNTHALEFPLIIKPQIGERGTGVEKLTNRTTLQAYLTHQNQASMLQEFIDWPEEFGVLWYQMPDGPCGISSLVRKSFLEIEGDGVHTFSELLSREERAQERLPYLVKKHEALLQTIPVKGERILLEPIGNHCRGTQFINANALINPNLVEAFKAIAQTIPGFYIGRFDVKAASIEDFLQGRNIKVMELNGITSEPGHIYHPGRGALKGWRDLWQHWNRVFKIGAFNRAKGYKAMGTLTLCRNLKMKEVI
jgi:hypothetical protein